MRKRLNVMAIPKHTLLWLYALVSLSPLSIMVLNSFRTMKEMAREPLAMPENFNFTSYEKAWVTASFETYFFNSMFVTITSVFIGTSVSLLAAYVFARSKRKIFALMEGLFLSGLLLPVFLAILPIFYLLDALGLISNLWGLILVYSALSIPFSSFILAAFFRQLPIDLEEAARIDGAGYFRTFFSILLPLVRPAIATVIVFRFVPIWNDFFYPLMLMRDRAVYTLPVGLTRFFGEYQTDWATLFAGLTIATIPLVILFVVASKQLISGLTAGMSK